MRTPLNPLFSDTKTLIENGKMEVNLVEAVIDALALWENVMKKQLATPYSERNDGDDNYKEKHNRRIDNAERIDKNLSTETKILSISGTNSSSSSSSSSGIQINNSDIIAGKQFFYLLFLFLLTHSLSQS